MTPPIKVKIWRESTVDYDERNAAMDSIEALANDLGTSATILDQGEVALGNYETYEKYKNEVIELAQDDDGWIGLLLYSRELNDGGDNWPNLGVSQGDYVSDSPTYVAVNAKLAKPKSIDFPIYTQPNVGNDVFKNIVKHEILHTLLKGSHVCPGSPSDSSADHTCGKTDGGRFIVTGSPMATGYFELPYANPNETLDDMCSGSVKNRPPDWTSELSECTRSAAKDWLDFDYSGSNPGDPPDLPPGLPTATDDALRK